MSWLRRIILAIALVFLAFDAFDSGGEATFCLQEFGYRWFQWHPGSYQLVEPAISRHISAALWDGVVLPIMLTPAFLLFFGLWLVLSLLGWGIGRLRARREEW